MIAAGHREVADGYFYTVFHHIRSGKAVGGVKQGLATPREAHDPYS